LANAFPADPGPDAALWWLSAAMIEVERVPPTLTFLACLNFVSMKNLNESQKEYFLVSKQSLEFPVCALRR
jgi:hypothetical protein